MKYFFKKIINNIVAFIYSIIFNLKMKLKPFAKLITNKKIRNSIIYFNNKIGEYTSKKVIINYYGKVQKTQNEEVNVVVKFLKNNSFNLFPYEFTKKYKNLKIEIFTDQDTGLKYALWDNKRLYFKRSCTEKIAKEIFMSLKIEQDIESPHRYFDDDFQVSENDIVADVGAAEGEFSLSIIEKVKKIYIFEADPELLEALQATFAPWKEKVFIVNKYVSNKTEAECVTLDYFFKDQEIPNFIKVDIEGAEYDLIQGGKKTLSTNKDMKVILASYHKHNDDKILSEEIQKFGFQTTFSKGYMLSLWDGVLKEPYLRRGLIRAFKRKII
jgi:hypothetical protein